VCDGDVFERNIELLGAFEKVCTDAIGDGFTLRDEFGGVELSNNGFEDFVADGGKNTFIVVDAEILWDSDVWLVCCECFVVWEVDYGSSSIPDRFLASS